MNEQQTTSEEILHLFTYDKERGVLIWRNPPQPNTKRLLGKIAGTLDKDWYNCVMIKRKMFKVHRVIWFLEKGEWPEAVIDHINGTKHDNRIENLRKCNHRENMQNMYRHREGRLLGAHWHKRSQTWHSSITIKNRKQIHLGSFSSALEAHEAYMKKSSELQNASR